MTEVCLSLAAETIKENLTLVQEYKKYITMLELRVDCLSSSEFQKVGKFPSLTDLPVILTFRRKADGGKSDLDESSRVTLLYTVLSDSVFNEKAFAYVDLEEDFDNALVEKAIDEMGIGVIRSFHDFSGVPENIEDRLKSLKKKDSDISKAAVMPKSINDCIRLYEAAQNLKDLKKIIIAMGPVGFHTRVLAKNFGSFLSFCSPLSLSAAPGQIDPKTLSEVYKLQELNEATDIYGIIGNPVMHTKSPYIHNPALKNCGLNAVYVPFHVDDLNGFMKYAELLNVKGLSVTIPFKEDIIAKLKTYNDAVDEIQSCNTIKKFDKHWEGINTDVYGFINPLMEVLKNKNLQNKKAVVIGAGGAAKSVVFALLKEGFKVLVLNRTVEKAKNLHDKFGCDYAALNIDSIAKIKTYNDLIIQTTSLGMHPDVENDPFSFYEFSGNEIVYDIIYNPLKTKLLLRAEEASCVILNGKDMLEKQAHKQFEYFTGKTFPKD